MKILIDMNLSPVWAEILASHEIEAIHWSLVAAADAEDSEIIAFARLYDYAIFTHDLDFSAIIAAKHWNKPSIVQLRTGDIIPESIVPLVINSLKQWAGEIEAGAILTIDLNKARLRILPLR